MGEALRGLTLRGRAFLAAGVTALVCALFLGHDELIRVAGLLLALPLVTAFFLGRSRYRLGLVRSMSPTQVSAGQQARVQLGLSNDGRTPTGTLLLEDHIPYVLGTRPRFVVDRMGPKWQRQVEYQIRSDVRGRFTVGPMRVRLSDPVRPGGDGPHVPEPVDVRGHPARGRAPPGAALGGVDRVG